MQINFIFNQDPGMSLGWFNEICVLISVLLSAFDIGLLEHPLSFLPCLLVVYLHSETRLQT